MGHTIVTRKWREVGGVLEVKTGWGGWRKVMPERPAKLALRAPAGPVLLPDLPRSSAPGERPKGAFRAVCEPEDEPVTVSAPDVPAETVTYLGQWPETLS
jgi:hypothetical protein